MDEVWQLYDERGKPVAGAARSKVLREGLLHGAAHVWIWRRTDGGAEVLVQKRSAKKQTWPNLFDISAAGHIDFGEKSIIAALREVKEEVGLNVKASQLKQFGIQRAHMTAPDGSIENEFRWLYVLQLTGNENFKLQKYEVAAIRWMSLKDFKTEVLKGNSQYVPHGKEYYGLVVDAIVNRF